MNLSFENKVALVTGAGLGTGLATAKAFAKAGAAVVLADISEDTFSQASEPKEFYIVPGAGHVDLYDRVNLIPWNKLPSFFNQHLNA